VEQAISHSNSNDVETLKRARQIYAEMLLKMGDKQHDSKMEDLKKQLEQLRVTRKEIPPQFICPITQEVFMDPVFTDDGHTYERAAIVEWLKNHTTSPLTNQTLDSVVVRPNHALRSAIDEFRLKNQ